MSVIYTYRTGEGAEAYQHIKTKIAIGCGTRRYGPEWIHNDIIHTDNIDCIGYAHALPVASESIDLVYASHILSYYDWQAAKALVLPEWKRILKPGGTLRIAVPNFDKLVRYYYGLDFPPEESFLSDIIGPLFGKMGGEEGLIYHKTTYDLETLAKMLVECGFGDIKEWDWTKTEHAHIDDHSQAYLPKIPLTDPDKKAKDLEDGTLISLNIECVKKGGK